MSSLRKSLAGVLVFSMLGLNFPGTAFCSEPTSTIKNTKKSITRFEPEIKAAPEKTIPVEAQPTYKKSYLWISLATLLVAGGVAAAAAGANSGSDSGKDNGDVTVNW